MMNIIRKKSFNSAGFTLVELIVVAPILMMTIILTMSYLFGQYGQLTQQSAEINLRVEAQSISFSMQDDIFFATSFASTKNSYLDDTYSPGGGWSSNTNPPTLIVATTALTTNSKDETRQPVYIDTLGCSPDEVKQQNSELLNNIIYFVDGTNLYKRTLTAPASLATCGTSYEKQTCPSANASSSCPADILLTDKLESFQLTYYTQDNSVTSTPEQAFKVKIDLQLKDRAYAEDIFADSSLTVKRLNQ